MATIIVPQEPQLRIGNVIMLNSGGPESIVVDLDGKFITAAWRDADGIVSEITLPELCFHRIRLGHIA